ncbi:MAG: hypothetical protein V8S57_07050 [Oscillospiraceae bacterium]
MEHPNTAWTDPMPRGARIAGWVYFPIHAVVLPLTLGMLLLAVLGELPSDVTCNVVLSLRPRVHAHRHVAVSAPQL